MSSTRSLFELPNNVTGKVIDLHVRRKDPVCRLTPSLLEAAIHHGSLLVGILFLLDRCLNLQRFCPIPIINHKGRTFCERTQGGG